MREQAIAASTPLSRRARTLAAALSVLFVGTALYAHNVRGDTAPGRADLPLASHPRDSIGTPTLATYAADALAPAGDAAADRVRAAVTIAWTSPTGRAQPHLPTP
jgi:hypothetical protein